MTEEVETFVARIKAKKIYLLISFLFDGVQVLGAKTFSCVAVKERNRTKTTVLKTDAHFKRLCPTLCHILFL
jgi:hypothetical protein